MSTELDTSIDIRRSIINNFPNKTSISKAFSLAKLEIFNSAVSIVDHIIVASQDLRSKPVPSGAFITNLGPVSSAGDKIS